MTLGERLRQLRDSVPWSQAECAVAAGVALSVVTNSEQGKKDNDPRLSSIFMLAKAFGKTVSEFLEGVDVPPKPKKKDPAKKKTRKPKTKKADSGSA